MSVSLFNAVPSSDQIDRNNRLFAFVFCAGLGVFGSVLTGMVFIAFAFILLLQFFGTISVWRHQSILQISGYFLFFYVAGVVLALIHFGDGRNLRVAVNLLPFLTFLPLVNALSLSPPNPIRISLEKGAALGGVLAIIFVAFEFSSGAGRAEGANGNAGPFAVAMTISYTLCLLGLVHSNNRNNTILMIIGIVASLLCVLASGMRASWPLLAVLPLIAAWSGNRNIFGKHWKFYIAGIIAAGVIASLFVGDLIASRFGLIVHSIEQIQNFGEYNNSLGLRLIMWDYARMSFWDSIFIGQGEAQALDNLAQFAKAKYGVDISFSHFHNTTVNAVMRGGIVELAATFALLVGPPIAAWKHKDHTMGRYGFTLMVSIALIYATSGVFNKTFGHDIQDILFTYLMAVATFFVFSRSVPKPLDNSVA